MRIAIGIEYDGTAYQGWQRQRNAASVQVRVEEAVSAVADAIRLLFVRNKFVAEGAGAIALAAALAENRNLGKTVCVVSGGNIDPEVIASILRSREP